MKLFRDRFASNEYSFIPHYSFILQSEPRYLGCYG
jgi:hypothetical protein